MKHVALGIQGKLEEPHKQLLWWVFLIYMQTAL